MEVPVVRRGGTCDRYDEHGDHTRYRHEPVDDMVDLNLQLSFGDPAKEGKSRAFCQVQCGCEENDPDERSLVSVRASLSIVPLAHSLCSILADQLSFQAVPKGSRVHWPAQDSLSPYAQS